MMISEAYSGTVFIADFTDYVNKPEAQPVDYRGVIVGTEENGIIPSFVIRNDNGFPFIVVNNEHNPAVFTREDGSKASQCECIIYADRHDNRKGWMLFLELKYCLAKNLFASMLTAISQLTATCKYILEERREFDGDSFKKYLVISTPETEPLDPFDASYFNQDDMLSVKEETGALLKAANEVRVLTPALVHF
jgi:hypothetical protein